MSFNVVHRDDGKYWCELSNSDHIAHPDDLVYRVNTNYQPCLVRVENYLLGVIK